jgi:hypothetical protein
MNTLLQILFFAIMVLGIQGAIRVLANGDPGLLAWLTTDISLLIAINVVIALAGGYAFIRVQKKARGEKHE